MTAVPTFVPTAEAAFIAGLTDRDMNRVVDEHILPDVLVQSKNGRSFARLGAAFAGFYFNTEQQFVANLRREILRKLTLRLELRADKHLVFDLAPMPRDLDWCVDVPNARIDVTAFIRAALERVRKVERANSLVQEDAEVMAGLAVFSGTRVPVEIVIASLDRGIDKQRIVASYPFLTDEHIEAARVYTRIHPKRGRPRRMSETHPNLKVKSSRVIRSAAKA
jgi:uncharacterized protein (DUF433 family)